MIFRVMHRMRFRYSAPAFLEPMALRLRPMESGAQTLEEFRLSLSPPPAGRSDGRDAFGNPATWVWFSGVTSELEIATQIRARTWKTNPFDFFLHPSAGDAPLYAYDAADREALAAYLRRTAPSAAADALARDLAAARAGDPIGFSVALAQWIRESIRHETRAEGGPMLPERTMAIRRGACRDLAELFCDACRSAGLAARFVSGYAEGKIELADRHLHAWSEVYLPGGGWMGFDPSSGLAVADRHLALAAAPEAAGAAPTSGAYRGDGVQSVLEYELSVRVDPDAGSMQMSG